MMALESAKTTPLSPLDIIMPHVYTRLILCIPTPTTAEPAAIATLLSTGLRMTVEQVPFLAGEVVPDTTVPERHGRFAMREPQQPDRLHFQSQDLRSETNPDFCSFRNLADENFPVVRFDGEILSPVGFLPVIGEGGGAVIMAAQANFIAGGLLLCVAVHHVVMDGIGVGTVLRLLAQNCREVQGENVADNNKTGAPASSVITITPESLDRTPLMSSGLRKLSTRQHPEYAIAPPSPLSEAPSAPPFSPPPPMEAKLFYFSGDALARLKNVATSRSPALVEPASSAKDGGGSWISTNDALSALLWSCITRARLQTSGGGTAVDGPPSKLGMANNGRRKLLPPLPDSYLGNVNLYSLAELPTATLAMADESLPDVASSVRMSVSRIDDLHIRSAVQVIESLPDVAKLTPVFNPYLGPHLAISTWAELGLNGLDFGKDIGTVDRVRVPNAKFDGLCIVLPRTRDGGLEVFVGLKVETMEKLVADEFFTRFAEFGR